MKVLNNEQWVSENFCDCEFGDKSISKRLLKVAGNMLARPEQSIPQQNQQWADVKAAYRFFDNKNVTFEKVAQTHWDQTRQTKPGRYPLICDTTDIDDYSHEATTGLGMLGDGQGRGVQLHNCLMYDCNAKLVCGAAGALLHYRKHKPKNETKTQRLDRDRETDTWWKLARPRLRVAGLSVYQFFQELAKLGGFLGRKHDGEPGWLTVWRGYRKLQSLLDGMKLVGAV